LWIATIVSYVGSWMQDVGAGWLMTSLSSSPSMVALVEAADSFPMMLLALPAGALADIVDRRRLLIAIQVYLLVVAGTLGVLTLLDSAWVLLGFTFAGASRKSKHAFRRCARTRANSSSRQRSTRALQVMN
jgi:MFS family permease